MSPSRGWYSASRQLGHDDDALADAMHEEVVLPGVGPVSFVDGADAQLAHLAQLAKRPDRFFELRAALLGVGVG